MGAKAVLSRLCQQQPVPRSQAAKLTVKMVDTYLPQPSFIRLYQRHKAGQNKDNAVNVEITTSRGELLNKTAKLAGLFNGCQ